MHSGFRDLNYARVRATEKYLRHRCDEVFIVSTIFRCTTDRSIGDIIRRCVQGQPIRIVCTRSEVGLSSPVLYPTTADGSISGC